MKARALLALMVLLLPASPVPAVEAVAVPPRTYLVHVKTLLNGDTDRTVLVPQVIAGALKKGHKVVVLFDAEGVLSLKMGRWFGGHSTPIDRVEIAAKERLHLAGLLGTTAEGIPEIYGSLLHFLKGRGVSVYVNKQALSLRGIDDEHFDHVAEAVEEERIAELLAAAGTYVSY
ncbi:MAG: hypothetical protein AABZ15_16945 [Nitrospirota bacterium]